jgi:hypothetical protein
VLATESCETSMDSTLSDDVFSQAMGDGGTTLDAEAQGHDDEDDAATDASGDDAAKDESNAGNGAPQVPIKVPVPVPLSSCFPCLLSLAAVGAPAVCASMRCIS